MISKNVMNFVMCDLETSKFAFSLLHIGWSKQLKHSHYRFEVLGFIFASRPYNAPRCLFSFGVDKYQHSIERRIQFFGHKWKWRWKKELGLGSS